MGVGIGSLYVRRSIFIDALPEVIWQQFADLDHIRQWLGLGHHIAEFTLNVGSRIKLCVDVDESVLNFGGKILCVEHERELSFESQWESLDEWPVPTIWTIRLTQLYEGTLVELFHHGFERLGKDAANHLQGYEEGWSVHHLTALRAIVEAQAS